MKTIIFFLLSSSLIHAQWLGDSRIYDNFYVKSITIDNVSTSANWNDEFADIAFNFIPDQELLITSVCQTANINIVSDSFAFTVIPGFDRIGSTCQNIDNATLEDLYFNFFTSNIDQFYTILLGWGSDGDAETFLYITSENGDYIYLENQMNLGTNNNLNKTLNIYPNPTNEYLFITNNLNDNLRGVIYDITGRIVIPETTIIDSKINVSNLNAGLYYLKLKDEVGNGLKITFLKE